MFSVNHQRPFARRSIDRLGAHTQRGYGITKHGFLLLACSLGLLMLLLGGCAQTATEVPHATYMFWPPAPDAPHMQYLTSFSSSADVTGQQSKLDEMIYGKQTMAGLMFQRPYGVRMVNGRIYVCDPGMSCVTVLDLPAKQVQVVGRTGPVTLAKPIDIAVAPDGLQYVADTGLGAVVAFDAKEQYAGKITYPKMRPVSLAIHKNELYVSDIYGSCVRVFDRISGKELRTIGEPGNKPGQLGGAMGVAVDNDGNVYINDVVGCRVQKFSHDGKFLSMVGGLGDRPGNFVRPKEMAVDSSGILYVVDNAFDNVQMFNDKGQMLMFFGGAGTHPGALDMPAGICVSDTGLDLFAKYVNPAFDAQRLVIVTNELGMHKVSVFALGELKPGKTLADISPGRVNKVVGFASKADSRGGLEAVPAGQNATQPATQPASQPATGPKKAP